ncbi:MAG TPA: secretin N-terminal domain-containing protein, partial [Candidatus Limnocylindria bacterium]|nr:secretin N-terminal domain-containing protein [Candidatus Limnocylindria bacterium]
MVSLNFNRADLIEIIHIIAQQLRLTYTIDPEVKGTVTINSSEPLRSEDLLPIFHQLLRMNGAVAVRTGNLYHIMPIKDGKGLARPIGRSREDSFALQIIPVRFFSVSEMKKVLTPFLQPGADIVENPRGNFLIVMDLPSNIQRLVEIADMIDVQVFAGTRMEIYQPKVASAEELAQEMTKVMQSFAASVPQAESFTAQFIALPRINQLLVISHSEAAWTYARRWLDRIDVVAEGPGRRIFIYAVENGKATELADVLNQAFGQPTTGSRSASQTLQSLHRSTTPTTTGQQQGNLTGSPSSFGSPGLTGQPRPSGFAQAAVAVPGQVPTPTPQQPGIPPPATAVPRPGVPSVQPQTQQQEQLRIVADPATNSLIIYGTAQEFQNIRNILKDLDAIPRQVLLEAMILQIDLKEGEEFGIDYEILRKPRQTIFGETFGSSAALRTLGKLFPAAPAFGGVSGLSAIVGDNTVSAMIRAAALDSRIKLISSPSVLASDNRPARIQVGSEEPIPTGTINAAVGNPNISSSTTIQYRNTGRILTIIPQVNSQGLVNLQIKAEV